MTKYIVLFEDETFVDALNTMPIDEQHDTADEAEIYARDVAVSHFCGDVDFTIHKLEIEKICKGHVEVRD